jgi:hypothetical protein
MHTVSIATHLNIDMKFNDLRNSDIIRKKKSGGVNQKCLLLRKLHEYIIKQRQYLCLIPIHNIY